MDTESAGNGGDSQRYQSDGEVNCSPLFRRITSQSADVGQSTTEVQFQAILEVRPFFIRGYLLESLVYVVRG